MENRIEKAKTLYEDKNYTGAYKICAELLKARECMKDALLLSAKCLLNQFDSPLNEEHNNVFYSTVKHACNEAKTIEEVFEIELDITTTLNAWIAENVQKQLAILEKDPTLEKWGTYIKLDLEYTKMKLFTQLSLRNSPLVNDYCKEKGIEKKDYAEMRGASLPKGISESEIHRLEYETALRTFEKTKKFLEENSDASADFVIEVTKVSNNSLLTTEQMIKYTIDNNEKDIAVKVERLKSLAEVISYILDAKIYPNGKEMSLYQTQSIREEYIEELRNIYKKIKTIDPEFIVPVLPDVEIVLPPKNNNSGGCYVATAVYGSYDCPEVWTLRRFRDNTLAATWYGRALIHTYYAVSPTLVKWFGNSEWFKNIWKPTLDKMVNKLNNAGVENTAYNDKNW